MDTNEKPLFYATILVGLVVRTDPAMFSNMDTYLNHVTKMTLELGDELRAQLMEREGSPF